MVAGDWPTALAPMQDVTSLPFMQVVARRGSPDFFFTEFIRVHAILELILKFSRRSGQAR